jgi:predicted ester cyclase
MSRSFRSAVLFTVTVLALAACGGETPEARTPQAAVTTTTAGPSESNKALVARAMEEIWQKKNPDAVATFFAPDLVNHAAVPEAQGAAGMKTIAAKLLAAFPDMTMTVQGISAEGDNVVVRNVMEGTQTGTLEFKHPLPATGKHVRVDQVHTFRVKDGRIVETWMVMDRLDLNTQLGIAK